MAERNLRLTEVRSPCDGVITGLDTVAGEYGAAGHPLFTIIDTEQWYAVGNFRETDLAGLQPGQHARVYVLGMPGEPVAGVVDSLGGWRIAGRGREHRRPAAGAAQPELGAYRPALPGADKAVVAAAAADAAWRIGRDRNRPVSGFALVQVDEGALQAGFAGLWRELQPRPGRLANTIRLVALVLITVAIGETFRMPEIAVSAYVVLFVSRDEQASTVLTAVVACVAVLFAVFATIVVFMASLSEPALRVPLIALATFGALFFSRISPLGPAAFAAGFILAYGLTIGDQVLGLALQSSGVSNTTGPGVPELLSIPPEEALLQFLLWLAPVVTLPVALVVVANLLTGRRPVALLRTGLADRLSACAGFCAGEPGAAQALTASARAGSAGFAKLHHFTGAAPKPPDYASLIRNSEQLALALLAWPAEDRGRALHPLAAGLEAAANSLHGGATTTQVPRCRPLPRQWPSRSPAR